MPLQIVAINIYPFGMIMPGRSYTSISSYRFGFSGKEKTDEIEGIGNSIDFGARIYDSRLAIWSSLDPKFGKYPNFSPYTFCFNNPIFIIDFNGKEGVPVSIVYGGNLPPGNIKLPILKPSQWYIINGSVDQNSFNHAAKYNTANNNAGAYTSIEERHDYYAWADIQIGAKNQWFAAAEVVTRWNAVGAAEGVHYGFLSDRAAKFLTEGNKFLFTYNMQNFKNIQQGTLNGSFTNANGTNISFKGLSGKSLDYALVEFEQSKVQEFISKYQKNNPKENIGEMMNSINSAMGSRFAPSEIRNVMDNYFNTDKGQKAFDFGNYKDRVKLGQRLVDQMYQKKAK